MFEAFSVNCILVLAFPIPSASSEDCLYLNIYAPTPSNLLLPVMIFIHGGDFNFGTGESMLPKFS